MYYLQTRYYDPELGRFISQDSLEYAEPETINGLNLYAYCGNNPVMAIDTNGESFFRNIGNCFKNIGNAIKGFFIDDIYGGIITPSVDWVVDIAAPAVSNFFTNSVPDFFVNKVWNGGIKPAWNAVSNFFTNTVPDFFVNTVWNKGILVAWNWLWHTKTGQIVYSGIALAVSIVGLVVSVATLATPASPLGVVGVVASVLGVIFSFASFMSALLS